MKGRKQKIPKGNYHQEVGAEHRGNDGVPTFVWITENNEVTPALEDGLLGKILSPGDENGHGHLQSPYYLYQFG